MRADLWRTVLHMSILTALVLTSNADNQDSECETVIQVRRNTVYQPSRGQKLIIKCPVFYCNKSPTISWSKLENITHPVPVPVSGSSHITAEWEQINSTAGILKLIFNKILRSDSGLYCCRSEGSQSHIVNVTVKGDGEFTTVKWQNDTSTTSLPPILSEGIMMYVYAAAGIVSFVFIVIVISVLSMRGCQGKSKKQETENQYIVIPVGEVPPASPQPSPRGGPAAPPCRRSTWRRPNENQHVRGKENEDRDEGPSVVYAALNHQPASGAAAPRPRRPQEEFSEYAAIRVS
ncbi:B- and T-lymphocyte attenuator isoform X1 [Echeneis naucrates]|uniref:B- and T-lymphocyte attenuator-like n=1 Tax=Echeneis naucrates TaxID=173247 RepID=A0A665WBI5_ECHNA|nr:B- and T-lymphocyte attenuator-like isoform X1 [Echeneis naucrates]